MLTITTIYFANLEAIREPLTNKIIQKELSDLENAERKVVIVYAGSSRVPTEGRRD
jgi:nickel-dependent lactate racemase